MAYLTLEHLTFSYPNASDPALRDVSMRVEAGDFVVVCGASGCGKTTLLRLLKRELAPHGEESGVILYDGAPLSALDARESARQIGFVLQKPEQQIVTDQVWHEMAFGLENLGLPTPVIRRRVGEMASFFGIEDWFHRDTATLSGGQKQLLNLAAVMVMQPRLLLLDEPTGQLDPIAAGDFIAALQKLNRELGLTVLLVEHRLEEVFPAADRVALLDAGRLVCYDTPRAVCGVMERHPMQAALPSASRIFYGLEAEGMCPITVKEGRRFLKSRVCRETRHIEKPASADGTREIAALRGVWFRYERSLPDVLRGASLSIREGETLCLLGGNAAGKTTLLQLLAGLDKPYRGRVVSSSARKGGAARRPALLPQDPQTVFVEDSVLEDWRGILRGLNLPGGEGVARIRETARRLEVEDLLARHPYDLSGGEQQKCALGKLLLTRPAVLLLDEPTKGLDARFKQTLRGMLRGLRREGVTVVMATHDIEFAAETADRCALLFDGDIVSSDAPVAFFQENSFYTTAANRIARGICDGAVTCAQVIARCGPNEGCGDAE